ncbi:endonuclease domain-containing protein [Azospirillum sp.]|uniref:endonuclease domain-containing protein n=1 Tax=Azospirillum sp. TaxID=34012 RepID=UPI002D365DED|nr:DUF559 domain-containing protein [Azospirillum sp.]HYD68632.1 DUF559 domain-containing protein [Azospirillum sp.]
MTTQRARQLRQSATNSERLLWGALRDRRLNGLKFRRQQQIGRYVVDFVCHERRLIIEVDGGQHSVAGDAERTAFLQAQGYRVLRFWNPEVLTTMPVVLETILAAAKDPAFTREEKAPLP